jgi:hypothetical protein
LEDSDGKIDSALTSAKKSREAVMAADFSIYGQVRSYEGTPIFNIKVSVYRDTRLVEHGFSDEEGRYRILVPVGEPIAVRFDTHPTLNNSRQWHPSVIAHLEGGKDIPLDRLLIKVGTTAGVAPDIDALAAYEFAAMWTAAKVDTGFEEYGKEAAARLSEMKFTVDVLLKIQQTLIAHFESL